MADAIVQLPESWVPRYYQRRAWQHMAAHDDFRAMLFWHRRSGKDDVALHMGARKSQQRVGNIWHMLPEAAQARKAIWDAVNPHTGKKRIDEAFPKAIRSRTNNTDMSITFLNGSGWQVVGSDNYNSLVGSSPMGIIFSEWALSQASAWGYLRPILLENHGWAAFITTPRGKNHAYKMLQGAKHDERWFTEVLGADKTGVFTRAQLEAEKRELIREHGLIIGEALFEQEYMCNFDAAIRGAYYTAELKQAREEGRIVASLPIERMPVHTAWDLGIGDDTAIWFFQEIGRDIRLVHYYASHGVGLDHYVEYMETWRQAHHVPAWGDVIWPHDGAARELGTGLTRQETMARLMGKTPRINSQERVDDGINAVRRIFPRLWIDESMCGDGLEAIAQYRREFDEKNNAFYPRPVHDWTSHPADALRTLAMGLRSVKVQESSRHRRALAPKIAII